MTKAVPYRQLVETVAAELTLDLSHSQLDQLATHFDLLVQWNRKVNLTAVRRPEEIATRHFEESLFLATFLRLPAGVLVDVGSGAGFPGLPLKVVWPSIDAVLLEPSQKKTAFLKEVIRRCGVEGVEVRTERLEEAIQGDLAGRTSLVTMRAVAPPGELLAELRKLLAPGGRLALFVGAKDASTLAKTPGYHWDRPVDIPRSERRVILTGVVSGSR